MKKSAPFHSQEERDIAINQLEAEIRRLMQEIEKAYGRLGRSLHALADQETSEINAKVDRMVELKQQLRKLRESELPVSQ